MSPGGPRVSLVLCNHPLGSRISYDSSIDLMVARVLHVLLINPLGTARSSIS